MIGVAATNTYHLYNIRASQTPQLTSKLSANCVRSCSKAHNVRCRLRCRCRRRRRGITIPKPLPPSSSNTNSTGRPRPHRSPRRSRIPLLQLQRHESLLTQTSTFIRSPTTSNSLILILETIPLVAFVLRAILRRRYQCRTCTMLGRSLSSCELPRCA